MVTQGKLNFTLKDIKRTIQDKDILFVFFAYILAFVVITVVTDCLKWLYRHRDSILGTFTYSVSFTFIIGVAYVIFLSSSYIFLKSLDIDQKLVTLLPAEKAESIYMFGRGFSITNSYGLFRRMTGVGGRPELIISGSYDGETWQEYDFYYKPGDVTYMPQAVMPFQPRFDWQIWFSALGKIENEFYLVHFLYKLLNGDNHAQTLLRNNPFKDKPPKYVKIDLYHYWFTDYKSQKVTFGLKRTTGLLE